MIVGSIACQPCYYKTTARIRAHGKSVNYKTGINWNVGPTTAVLFQLWKYFLTIQFAHILQILTGDIWKRASDWLLHPYTSARPFCSESASSSSSEKGDEKLLMLYCRSRNISVENLFVRSNICRRSLMTHKPTFSGRVVTSWELLGVVISLSTETLL